MNNDYERLFFALWPEPEVRSELQQRITQLNGLGDQGRWVNPANLHITLHFLGNVPRRKIDCFLNQAARVRSQPFELKLSVLGYFKKPKVVWIGSDNGSQHLSKLHAELGKRIAYCGYSVEQRLYHPHVTVARKVKQAPILERLDPIVWPVHRFVLVRSFLQEQSVEYRLKALFDF